MYWKRTGCCSAGSILTSWKRSVFVYTDHSHRSEDMIAMLNSFVASKNDEFLLSMFLAAGRLEWARRTHVWIWGDGGWSLRSYELITTRIEALRKAGSNLRISAKSWVFMPDFFWDSYMDFFWILWFSNISSGVWDLEINSTKPPGAPFPQTAGWGSVRLPGGVTKAGEMPVDHADFLSVSKGARVIESQGSWLALNHPTSMATCVDLLVGGFKHFLFSIIYIYIHMG